MTTSTTAWRFLTARSVASGGVERWWLTRHRGLKPSGCTASPGRSPMADRGSDHVNTVGEPDEGKLHVRFDEGRLARHRTEPVAYSADPSLHLGRWPLEPEVA